MNIRQKILKASYDAGACHIGSALSCVDILRKLFNKKGIIALSKVSGLASWYCLKYDLKTATRLLRSNPVGLGSLGHGLPIATGMALADRKVNIYCLMSDAELQEGSTWECLLFAVHHKLKNLYIFIDNNKLQACGFIKDILNIEPLVEKFKAFGCSVKRIDGHNEVQLNKVLKNWRINLPKIVICDTIKGKDISFLENKVEGHYLNLTKELYEQAIKEIE
jgi:transketolase